MNNPTMIIYEPKLNNNKLHELPLPIISPTLLMNNYKCNDIPKISQDVKYLLFSMGEHNDDIVQNIYLFDSEITLKQELIKQMRFIEQQFVNCDDLIDTQDMDIDDLIECLDDFMYYKIEKPAIYVIINYTINDGINTNSTDGIVNSTNGIVATCYSVNKTNELLFLPDIYHRIIV